MRAALGAAFTVVVAMVAFAQPVADVPLPEGGCRLALEHLSRLPAAQRGYVRYLFAGAVPAARRAEFRRVLAWWLQNLSWDPAVSLPREVPNSGGQLLWIDLRWYRWNGPAWAAVAEREPYTRQPFVADGVANELRGLVGYKVRQPDRDRGDVPVVAVVRADWLFRETIDLDRSPSYLDLLFARQRYPGWDWWPGGKDKADGRDYAAGWYTESKTPFVDFPKDEADWNKAFGVDLVRRFGKDAKLDLDFGAIVAGGADEPGTGSIVALQNRLLVTVPTPINVAMQSYDVLETSGKRDYSETLVFDFESDAHEYLAYLPNGGQAAFLTNKEKKRITLGDAKAVNPKFVNQMIPGVRVPGDCFRCHGFDAGFILPQDRFTKAVDRGLRFNAKDPEKVSRIKSFFFDWQQRVPRFQEPYRQLARQASVDPCYPQDGPLQLPDLIRAFDAAWRDYDEGVDAAQACREWGIDGGALKRMAVRSPKYRMLSLVQGETVPRRTFEKDVYREGVLQLRAGGVP
jgi:hypothetical protein